MPALDHCLTIADLKGLARRRAPKMFFDYADSGSWTESTYRENESDFQRIKLRQRIAVNLEGRTLATDMLGVPVAMPVALAPTGLTGMFFADGEILAAKAAEKSGLPFTLSTMSICSIEDVAENTSAPFWFQLYVMRDRGFIERLIDRAKAAKCPALVLTMDLQILGQRHKDVRNGLSAPPKFTLKHLWQMAARPRWALGMLGTQRRTFRNLVGHVGDVGDLGQLAAWTNSQFDPTLSWKDVGWVKQRFGGRIIVKGVLDPEDARQAVAHGADAVIVSNHGGRQLDGAPSSIRVLPEIVEAVGGRAEVYLDGGIRSGQDVLKALALGAKSTFIGRAFLYGLAAGGEAGVTRALDVLRRELDLTMALCGERDIKNVGRGNIYHNGLLS
jgi:L-lactate dehydrogenase (cytochrome)